MKQISSEENNNLINEINKELLQEEALKNGKYHKKTGNICHCLNTLEQYGPLYIISNQGLFVSKMELVKFNDHFDDLFEKGKIYTKEQDYDENKNSIPDITFWNQRYYYYSKYDEGILMDRESN